jgi:hypothetical protein
MSENFMMHAPIDSEIYALFDSIKASYSVYNGLVTVTTYGGEVWMFSEPTRIVDEIHSPDAAT